MEFERIFTIKYFLIGKHLSNLKETFVLQENYKI